MVVDDASLDRTQRRQLRLVAELADEAVDLQLANDDPAYSAIIDEIGYARQSPVHEGRRSSYGAFVIDEPERLVAFTAIAGQSSAGKLIGLSGTEPGMRDLNHIRKMCNGRTTFLVRSPRGPEALLELDLLADEQRLAQLISPKVMAVQRTPDGAVKVFAPSHVYVFEHDEWRAKVYWSDAAAKLRRILFPKGPKLLVDRLADLLSFCLHILSSRHIGSTFVWFPYPERLPIPTPQSDWGRVPSADLFIGQQYPMSCLPAPRPRIRQRRCHARMAAKTVDELGSQRVVAVVIDAIVVERSRAAPGCVARGRRRGSHAAHSRPGRSPSRRTGGR